MLLAVLLLGQLAAFQIPAFAADAVPDVHNGAADFLKLIGVDITAFTKLVDTLNSLPSVFDSTRVAFAEPRGHVPRDGHRLEPEL